MPKKSKYIKAINDKCDTYEDYLKSDNITNVTYRKIVDESGEYWIFTRNHVPRSWKAIKIKIR